VLYAFWQKHRRRWGAIAFGIWGDLSGTTEILHALATRPIHCRP
jgi:hypothetical protein